MTVRAGVMMPVSMAPMKMPSRYRAMAMPQPGAVLFVLTSGNASTKIQ